jgi:hypothetical protein
LERKQIENFKPTLVLGTIVLFLIATCGEPTRILLRKKTQQVSHSFQAMQNSLVP